MLITFAGAAASFSLLHVFKRRALLTVFMVYGCCNIYLKSISVFLSCHRHFERIQRCARRDQLFSLQI